MSSAVDIALLVIAGAGHVVLWVALINRLHGLAIPHRLIDVLSLVCWILMWLVLVTVAIGFFFDEGHWTSLLYLIPCTLLTVYSLGRRVIEHRRGQPEILVSNHTHVVDVAREHGQSLAAGRGTKLLSRLPKNEVFRFHVQRKTLAIERLCEDLKGLTIAHLSDLHISGRIEAAFYEEVVRSTNEQEPDIVTITGDLFDNQACVEWGAAILGKLKARYGVYFVLGNHDQRIDSDSICRELEKHGLHYLGSRWTTLDLDGGRIVLAGNELPWFVPAADMENCSEMPGPDGPLRILLSHAPDQIEWARRYDFDLMLAGHTHGGQIRLPLLGPIVAPSRLGTQYASGTFHLPPTVLHVSRGVSSLTPLRWNCPPELAILELQSDSD